MPKCMYKCSDDTCASSLSEHHCQVVSDAICSECEQNQDKPTISTEQRLRRVISEALELIPNTPDNGETISLLSTGLS